MRRQTYYSVTCNFLLPPFPHIPTCCNHACLQEYTEEIERLKKDLYAAREKNGIFLSAENYSGMESKIRSQQELIKELEDKITANLEGIEKVSVYC